MLCDLDYYESKIRTHIKFVDAIMLLIMEAVVYDRKEFDRIWGLCQIERDDEFQKLVCIINISTDENIETPDGIIYKHDWFEVLFKNFHNNRLFSKITLKHESIQIDMNVHV